MAQSPTVTLYTYALSPFGMKVYWTMIYKKIAFDLVYVHPGNHAEIAFTGQKMVPVVKIDDAWKLNSADICIWLDEVFHDAPVAGQDADTRRAILETDEWVTDTLFALGFRAAIDLEESETAAHNGHILARTMRNTSGGVPEGAEQVWPDRLRQVPFVVRDAAKIDPAISMSKHRADILAQFETRLERTGFLAGTEGPSIADLAAYGRLVSGPTFDLKGGLETARSPIVMDWLQRMQAMMVADPVPALVPGWRLHRF